MSQVWSRVVSVLIQGGLWGWEALQKLSSETHISKAKVNWKSFELNTNASEACFNMDGFEYRVLGNCGPNVFFFIFWERVFSSKFTKKIRDPWLSDLLQRKYSIILINDPIFGKYHQKRFFKSGTNYWNLCIFWKLFLWKQDSDPVALKNP